MRRGVRADLRPGREADVHLRPDDEEERIIRKLHRGLGDGNYDLVHMISG